MDTILLPSAGGLTGVFLTNHFKKTSSYRLVATDLTLHNPLAQWVDVFSTMPPIKDPTYPQKLLELCKKESVDYIFPVTSRDVDFFSDAETATLFHSYPFLVIDQDFNALLSNKKSCYAYLNSLGVRTPRIYTKENIQFPAILKPQKGSGSKNTYILLNNDDLNYWTQKLTDSFISEFIEGEEFTVDALFDLQGEAVGYNVRKRMKTVSGGATISQNISSINVEEIIKVFESSKRVKGPLNFQFKILPNNEIVVFDVNTRLASGGLALTVASGFDIPNLVINLLKNKPVPKWHLPKEKSQLTMVRYYQEFFINE